MSKSLPLEVREFPARIAELGFRVELPVGWKVHDLPEENPDFSNPTQFEPLAIVTAPHAAIVYAFAARPGYEEGALHQWAWYLLGESGLKPRTVGRGEAGVLPAIVGEAVQDSDVGPMLVRFVFCEDGGRLINFTLTAPESLADSMNDAWVALLRSFTLTTPRGPTIAIEAPTATPNSASPEPDATTEAAPARPDAAPEPADQPAWWQAAVALEKLNKFEAAEKTIIQALNHLGAFSSIAELYRLRMHRLRQAGDLAGALDARRRAAEWISSYAAGATSGGEGAALSLQRDEFLAQLDREFPH